MNHFATAPDNGWPQNKAREGCGAIIFSVAQNCADGKGGFQCLGLGYCPGKLIDVGFLPKFLPEQMMGSGRPSVCRSRNSPDTARERAKGGLESNQESDNVVCISSSESVLRYKSRSAIRTVSIFARRPICSMYEAKVAAVVY